MSEVEEQEKGVICASCGLLIYEGEPFFEREEGNWKVHRSVDCLLDEFAGVAVILEVPRCAGCEKPIAVSTGEPIIILDEGLGFCHYNPECVVKAIERGE